MISSPISSAARIRGLRLLAAERVGDRMRRGDVAAGEPLTVDASLREALSLFVARNVDRLPVSDASGTLLGSIHLADLVRTPAPDAAP